MFARTERLLLRPGWAEDAPALAVAIGDPAVARHLGRVPLPYSEEDARAFLNLPIDPLLPRFLITARTRGAPRLIGGIGIYEGCDGRPELGYWIGKPYWGLGFATEAGRQVMRIARAIGLPPLTACHHSDNPASGRVLAKLGFRPTGAIERRPSAARGHDVPCILFEEGESQPAEDDTMFSEMLEEDDRAMAA